MIGDPVMDGPAYCHPESMLVFLTALAAWSEATGQDDDVDWLL